VIELGRIDYHSSLSKMADPAVVPAAEAEDELVDYEEDVDGGEADADKAVQGKSTKGSYVGAARLQL